MILNRNSASVFDHLKLLEEKINSYENTLNYQREVISHLQQLQQLQQESHPVRQIIDHKFPETPLKYSTHQTHPTPLRIQKQVIIEDEDEESDCDSVSNLDEEIREELKKIHLEQKHDIDFNAMD
jgi:2,3-bisphosphoglycerate-independent phosphoglycerate mutase